MMTLNLTYNREQVATGISLIFHVFALFTIISNNQVAPAFVITNLLLSMVLIIWTQRKHTLQFYIFMFIIMAGGFSAYLIGLRNGFPFGNFTFGDNLGPKLWGVPIVLTLYWFILIYTSGMTISALLRAIFPKEIKAAQMKPIMYTWVLTFQGAMFATFIDAVLQPVAQKFGFWQWFPEETYLNWKSWVFISMFLMIFYRYMKFPRYNKFAIHLYMIHIMFWMVIRMYYGLSQPGQ